MTEIVSPRTEHALELFAPLGPSYDHCARLLSLGQDPRWRRFLVRRVPSGANVLDVATGTGMVARELVRRTGCTVVGLDQSAEMLATAAEQAGVASRALIVKWGALHAVRTALGAIATVAFLWALSAR